MLDISTKFGADLSSWWGWVVAVCWELDGLCGWGGWATCVTAPLACQAGTLPCQALGSKSSLCTYLRMLLHPRHISGWVAFIVFKQCTMLEARWGLSCWERVCFCCCSLCCVRASRQSPCRVLWSCVLHSTSSVIVSRVLWKLCHTPQALSLFPKSWNSVLCLPLCLCPFLLVYCPPVYIYCSGLGTFPPVSFPPLQVSSFALLPLISVSFPPLQSPWCSVTQGPFESRF